MWCVKLFWWFSNFFCHWGHAWTPKGVIIQRRFTPPGYATSGSICRAFLEQHAPKKAENDAAGELGTKPASPGRILSAEKIEPEKDVVIPGEAKASTAAMSTRIESNQSTKPGKGRRKTGSNPARLAAERSTTPTKRARKAKAAVAFPPPTPAQNNFGSNTPLKIPYGNKEVAQKLGARYGAGGWYAPPGVDLVAFGERGWL